MVSQGISLLYWVAKCRRGFCNIFVPGIHIFAGEKVCIQVMTPATLSRYLISFITVIISSSVVTTSLKTSGYGKFPCSFKASMIFSVCTRTSFSVSLPYKCWLPTTNQNSFSLILIIPTLPLIYYFNFVHNTHLFHFFSNN